MKNKLLITMALVASFISGFAFSHFANHQKNDADDFKRATGIGGIFFKCKDPAKVRDWYKTHLGLNVNKYGTNFEWRQASDSTKKGYTAWSPFSLTTKYFGPTAQDFMINYRVADLNMLLIALKKEGVTIADTVETVDYGKFVHIIDVEGNKVELWEPKDIVYEKMGNALGSGVTK